MMGHPVLCGAVGLLQTLDSGLSGFYIEFQGNQEFVVGQQPHLVPCKLIYVHIQT